MGSESVDEELSSALKLPLFSIPANIDSPERPGMLTPPIHASASVPFRWEEEPGKPKPCTALITLPDPKSDLSPKCLELPPRLLLMDPSSTKLSSPTTVLDGPYVSRSKFHASSFRMNSECYGSFRKNLSPERDHDQLGANAMVLSKIVHKEKGALGSRRKKGLNGKKEVGGGGSYIFPSSVDRDSECSKGSSSSTSDKITTIRRAGSFTTISSPRSHFWATVYGGLKQVVPWRRRRSRKVKKDGGLLS